MAAAEGAIGGGGGGAVERGWLFDERDGFISWLKSEFAAANGIIDSFLGHLHEIGAPGQYEHVAATVNQRRVHWAPVVYLQQHFPVSQVYYALHQARWRRHQQLPPPRPPPAPAAAPPAYPRPFDGPRERDGRKGAGFGNRHGHRFDGASENRGSVSSASTRSDAEKRGDVAEKGVVVKERVEAHAKGNSSSDAVSANAEGDGPSSSATNCEQREGKKLVGSESSKLELAATNDVQAPADQGASSNYVPHSNGTVTTDIEGNVKPTPIPKEFESNDELSDGRMVNIVEGLKLYDGLLDATDMHQLLSWVNEMRSPGYRGKLQGQPMTKPKRPTKGHGRETIQLGIPMIDGPPEDRMVEAIPSRLQDVLDRLVRLLVLPAAPDYCIVDIFKEGDHSHPLIWPSSYGRPVSTLCLADCDMVFGRAIAVVDRGEYNGALRLSLQKGSLLLLQGKSADLAKHAIPSMRKERILLTFGKSQPRKNSWSENSRFNSPSPPPSSQWGQPSFRMPNLLHHPPGPSYGAVLPTGVLPPPPIHPHQHLALPPNGIPPLFISPAPPAAVPYPPPPMHSAPWLPLHGTGVFLPPGSSQATQAHHSPVPPFSGDPGSHPEAFPLNTNVIATGTSNGHISPAQTSPKNNSDETGAKPVCNGGSNHTSNASPTTISVQEQENRGGPKVANKPRASNPSK